MDDERPVPDVFESAFLARTLHDLRLCVSEQCDAILAVHGVTIPGHCASLLLTLEARGEAGPLELSQRLACSHQLIDQRIKLLKKLSMISRRPTPGDRRRNSITLTASGRAEATRLRRVLPLIAEAVEDLNRQLELDLRKLAERAHRALSAVSLAERVAHQTV